MREQFEVSGVSVYGSNSVKIALCSTGADAEMIADALNSREQLIDALRVMREQFYRHTCKYPSGSKYSSGMICDRCKALNAADAALALAAGERGDAAEGDDDYDMDAERVKFQQRLEEAMVKAGARRIDL